MLWSEGGVPGGFWSGAHFVGKLLRTLIIVAAFLAVPSKGAAQPTAAPDYGWESTSWNGLGELRRVLIGLGRPIAIQQPIDLSLPPASAPIVLIYPEDEIPVGDLLAFVEAGGRLLVADDFGSAARGAGLFEALGVRVNWDVQPHTQLYRGNPDLPLLRPAQHAVTVSVSEVLANHPAALQAEGIAILPFDDDRYALAYEIRRGAGTVLVLGDPSIMVNFMMDIADNRTFVLNLIDYLCEGVEPLSQCHVRLAARGVEMSGRPAEPPEQTPMRRRMNDIQGQVDRSVTRANEALSELREYRPAKDSLYVATLVLALGTSLFLVLALPLVRPRWLSFRLGSPTNMRSRSEFEWNLERLVGGRRDADLGLVAAILKEETLSLLTDRLRRPASEERHAVDVSEHTEHVPQEVEESDWTNRGFLSSKALVQRFAAAVVPDGSRGAQRGAEARCAALMKALARIPWRNQLVPEVDERYSERQLRRLHGDIRDRLQELGAWEEYERRLGRP